LFFAINKIGAISNFIHPKMPVKNTEMILKEMNPKAIFIMDNMYEKLEILKEKSISQKYVVVNISNYLQKNPQPKHDFHQILYHLFLNKYDNYIEYIDYFSKKYKKQGLFCPDFKILLNFYN
jgi:acyl-coenzyme A synthetase/AMP-(fatty) acid ligase